MLHNYQLAIAKIPLIAQTIGDKFSSLAQVVAVVLAGYRTTIVTDESSDFDFYVYFEEEIPVDMREAIARQFSDRIAINNQFWEPRDEWIDINTGCGIDIWTGLKTVVMIVSERRLWKKTTTLRSFLRLVV
ncbi:hypothetical protein QUB10_20150 [Microcoleus sp. B5-D4]|uniref:hypothetical protein n=1 Tax=unclassified Microcoleus TaxID=2642155 RepID=UPI002FCEBE63